MTWNELIEKLNDVLYDIDYYHGSHLDEEIDEASGESFANDIDMISYKIRGEL